MQLAEQRRSLKIRSSRKSEPVDGKFEDVTATILNDIDSDTDEEADETSSDR